MIITLSEKEAEKVLREYIVSKYGGNRKATNYNFTVTEGDDNEVCSYNEIQFMIVLEEVEVKSE